MFAGPPPRQTNTDIRTNEYYRHGFSVDQNPDEYYRHAFPDQTNVRVHHVGDGKKKNGMPQSTDNV